jgi:hypothetical protein
MQLTCQSLARSSRFSFVKPRFFAPPGILREAGPAIIIRARASRSVSVSILESPLFNIIQYRLNYGRPNRIQFASAGVQGRMEFPHEYTSVPVGACAAKPESKNLAPGSARGRENSGEHGLCTGTQSAPSSCNRK